MEGLKKMINDTIQTAADKQNRQTVGVIKKLSLNLVEKWRKIRESNKYADSFFTPKLIVRY